MEILIIGKRGSLDELYHTGSICIVDENSEVIYSLGDQQQKIFMRSSSKVFQILPLLYLGLDKKYQLTLDEIAIMTSSHIGSLEQLEIIERIMKKTGIKESDFCIKPAYPISFATTKYLIENKIEPKRYFHMCSGKHLGLMLVEKEFTDKYQNYYKTDSNATKLSLEYCAKVGQLDQKTIEIGLDGCGVPVYGITLYQAAILFRNIACPNFADKKLNEVINKVTTAISTYPDLVRGANYFCSQHNYDKNVVAKDGAHGFYAFGLKKEKIGVAFKIFSGDMNMFGYITKGIYQKIGYSSTMIDKYLNFEYTNDNDEIIGKYYINF